MAATEPLETQSIDVDQPPRHPPADSPDPQEKASVADEINAMLLALLPWGISILFHVGMIILAIFIVWSTTRVQKEDVIIPVAQLSSTPGAPMSMRITQKLNTTTQTRRTISKTTQKHQISVIKTSMSLIGAAGGSPIPKTTPFDVDMPASGVRATMYGSGGNAYRLAYIIDASGSLVDSLPFVIEELKNSIRELSEKQSFTVIFFQGENAIEVPPTGLNNADAQFKQQVIDWIDISSGHIVPAGQSNPVNALKLALRYKPQLIFLLSDNITGQGQYEVNQKHLLVEIEKANTSKTKINTIQFLYPDPLVQYGYKPTMQEISERTGGIYKFIDGKELGIQ